MLIIIGLIGLLMVFSPVHGEGQTTGTLIVLSKSENKAEFFSIEHWKKVGEVPTGVAPHEVAISPDGKTAVITNYGNRQPGNTLTVINIPSLQVTQTIDLGEYRRPHGILFKNEQEVVVTAEGQQALIVVNVSTGKITQVVKTNQQVSHMVALSPDGKRAFVANIGSGSVSQVNLEKGELERTIPAQEGTEGIAWQPGSDLLWFSNRGANTMMIYQPSTGKILDTLKTADFPIRIAMAHHQPLALVSCAKAGVVEIWDYQKRQLLKRLSMEVQAAPDVETRLFRDRFGKSPVPIGVVVSGSQHLAFVANSNADVVAVIDLKTLSVIRYLPTAKQPDGMGWTPITF